MHKMRDVPHTSQPGLYSLKLASYPYFLVCHKSSLFQTNISSVCLCSSSLAGLNRHPCKRVESRVVLWDERWHGCSTHGRSHTSCHIHTQSPPLSFTLSHQCAFLVFHLTLKWALPWLIYIIYF